VKRLRTFQVKYFTVHDMLRCKLEVSFRVYTVLFYNNITYTVEVEPFYGWLVITLSRLDYSNWQVFRPKIDDRPIVAAIMNLGPRDDVTAAFRQLHWLPAQCRVQFKLYTMMYTPSTLSRVLSTSSTWCKEPLSTNVDQDFVRDISPNTDCTPRCHSALIA